MSKGGRRKWDTSALKIAAKNSTSIRQVLILLGLVPAGGNYVQVQRAIKENRISISHFTGQGWSKGRVVTRTPIHSLEKILTNQVPFSSYKLKRRLFKAGIKQELCELCGWKERSADGRVPLELDHINGNSLDNALANLRVLCPNCHSLQPTHRGRNKKRRP